MRLSVNDQIIINAPATDVWRVLAHDFDKIGEWSSGITESKPLTDITIPEGASTGGRVCYSDNVFGDAYEAFTHYDEKNMRFGYKAIGEIPRFFKSGENNWSVIKINDKQSQVKFAATVEVDFLIAVLMLPVFPILKKVLGSRTLEELKYFVENGQPHTRKQKQLATR